MGVGVLDRKVWEWGYWVMEDRRVWEHEGWGVDIIVHD